MTFKVSSNPNYSMIWFFDLFQNYKVQKSSAEERDENKHFCFLTHLAEASFVPTGNIFITHQYSAKTGKQVEFFDIC